MRPFSWKFPHKKFHFMRIEKFFVILLAVIVFFWSLEELPGRWWLALLLAISLLLQKFRHVEEHYRLTSQHLHVEKHTPTKVQKAKVPLKDIGHHKISKTFLGGYVLTKRKKKHLVFFNSKKELHHFKKAMEKHTKK